MTFLLTPWLMACSAPAVANDLEIDAPAPTFSLTDTEGATWSLDKLKGKTVVLEWFNPGCPFVVAAHEEGPLSDMASKQPDDVVWLAINSGAPGKQGASKEANVKAKSTWSMDHPILLDADGAVGRAYGATNTPQMVVINPDGKLTYYGALDNAPFNRAKNGKRTDFTSRAIAAAREGKSAKPARTKPYGCSVKYGS